MKKVRYCKQYDDWSCGPIAVLNILKWAGYPHTTKHLPHLKRKLKHITGEGTYVYMMTEVLRSYKRIKISPRVFRPSLRQICSRLDRGEIVLLTTAIMKGGKIDHGHYCLCVGKSPNDTFFTIVNDDDKAEFRVSRKRFEREWLKKVSSPEYGFFPDAIFIRKSR